MTKRASDSHLDFEHFKKYMNDVIKTREIAIQKRIYAGLKKYIPGWEHVDTFTTFELLEKLELDKIRIEQVTKQLSREEEYTLFQNINGEDVQFDKFTVSITNTDIIIK